MVLPAQHHRAPTAAPCLVAPAASTDPQAVAEQLLTGHFADRPAPRAWGWATPGGGRSANVEGGVVYQATSAQVCGLYPFALSSGAATPGVPIGRHMLTAEPVGLDPAEWLREGLVSNTGVWVQGQPGIGKSTIVKRMLTGLICFGAAAVIPGDVKGEYSDLVDALGGRVWRIGRGRHTLNPLDAGPLRAAAARTSGADRDRLLETIRARQLSLLEALVVIVRRGQITVTERLILGEALDLAAAHTCAEPIIPDVLAQLTNPPQDLLRIAATTSAEEFGRELRDLINSLGLLCQGAIPGHVRPALVGDRGFGHAGDVAGYFRAG